MKLSPRRCTLKTGIWLFIFFLPGFLFLFTILRRGATAGVKRGLWNHGGPTVVQSLGLLCLRLHSLPYYRSDSFHSSAFDHPRRRIRYSNASESARLSLPPTLSFVPFVLNPILPIYLSPFRGVTSVTVGCRLHELACALSLVLFPLFFFSLFFISTTAVVYSWIKTEGYARRSGSRGKMEIRYWYFAL